MTGKRMDYELAVELRDYIDECSIEDLVNVYNLVFPSRAVKVEDVTDKPVDESGIEISEDSNGPTK